MCECVRERTGKRERETILVILPLHQHCYLEAVQSILNSITSVTKTTTLHNSASYNKRQHLCTRIKNAPKLSAHRHESTIVYSGSPSILVILPLHQHCYLKAPHSTTKHPLKRQHLCTRIFKKRALTFSLQHFLNKYNVVPEYVLVQASLELVGPSKCLHWILAIDIKRPTVRRY